MNVRDIIKRKPYLLWSTRNFDGLSDEAVVEAVLHYGDWEDVQRLFRALGLRRTARIFRRQTQRRRCNYDTKVKHFFTLYFAHHAR